MFGQTFWEVNQVIRTLPQVIYYTRIHTNAGAMFGYPMLADYQWFWRLDSDSFILGPLDQDPFRRMAQVPTECVLYRICSL